MHRDSLFDQDMYVQRITSEDIADSTELISSLAESKSMKDMLYDCAVNPTATNYGFVAKVQDDIVGAFVISEDVNLEFYISHFHIQD